MICRVGLAEQQVIPVWPDTAPGSEAWAHHEIAFHERPLPAAPPMIMFRDVVTPTLTVYPAAAAKRSGIAMIVCPGGGGETGGRQIPSDAPPLFAVVAEDDPMMAGKVVDLYLDWKAAKIPAELHVYAKGGHGFGTIKQGLPVEGWLDLLSDWVSGERSTIPHR